ncbi:DUF3300 domain-containing protein [Bordetella sp. LUAb4]|uniref:DUF3300 domain-containing protein n=1 Tax=Bordetella sp. LUAb4 TaxID=2843195 RepID=UPI001E5551FD|nr:DUF3300 domain-containing protein [Bordetella sp. LUAb4]
MGIGPSLAADPPAQPPSPVPQETPQPPSFSPEEIESLVAPIALYPDPVLAQVLMASTYPLEIVHAARWLKANPKLKGDAAVKAVESQPWDVSVKSLVAFPQILTPMNDKLDWTQKLGDAFLAQQQDVFAAVQRLRKRAQEAGNLTSNVQQNVVVEPAPQGSQTTVVRIESADPQVIYVPSYNPTVVYGAWSAPAYPPTYWPPPPAYYPGTALMSGLAWGVGIAAAGAIFSDCDWGGGDVDIDYNKVTNIDRNTDRTKAQGQSGRWQHDPGHRQGVAYRDNATRQKMAGQVPGAEQRAQYRGRDAAPNAGRSTTTGATAGRNTGTGLNRGTAPTAGAGRDAGMGANRNASAGRDAGTGANRSAAAGAGAGRAASPGSGAGRRADTTNPAVTGHRTAPTNQGNMTNRATGSHGGGARGTGRDSAFTGVGGGGTAAQRSHDRGRASMQGSGASRASIGGGGRGGGGGGMRGGGGRR